MAAVMVVVTAVRVTVDNWRKKMGYSLSKFVFRYRRACICSRRNRRVANKQTRALIADIRFLMLTSRDGELWA